jgi:hypothetical protein
VSIKVSQGCEGLQPCYQGNLCKGNAPPNNAILGVDWSMRTLCRASERSHL